MSNEQRMCICGHQKNNHDRRDREVRWGGCWGLTPANIAGHVDVPCPCGGFMWVGASRVEAT